MATPANRPLQNDLVEAIAVNILEPQVRSKQKGGIPQQFHLPSGQFAVNHSSIGPKRAQIVAFVK